MKTLQELEALSETDEGKQQIRVMVAGLFGWQMIKGERPSSLGHLIAQLDGKTGFVPFYHTSLDAIIPEVRKLDLSGQIKHCRHLSLIGSGKVNEYLVAEWMATSAYAIHHCIALLLTLQRS